MRVSEEEEKTGLDVTEHSASGYPDFRECKNGLMLH